METLFLIATFHVVQTDCGIDIAGHIDRLQKEGPPPTYAAEKISTVVSSTFMKQ